MGSTASPRLLPGPGGSSGFVSLGLEKVSGVGRPWAARTSQDCGYGAGGHSAHVPTGTVPPCSPASRGASEGSSALPSLPVLAA